MESTAQERREAELGWAEDYMEELLGDGSKACIGMVQSIAGQGQTTVELLL